MSAPPLAPKSQLFLGGFRAGLPIDAAALEDLLATVKRHVEFSVADHAAFARGGVLHDLNMLALEVKKLRSHLRDRLACLSLGVAADWRLEFT